MGENELDDLIAERTAHNPELPSLIEAARQRRAAERDRAARRERLSLTEEQLHIKATKVLPHTEKHARSMPERAVRRNNS